MIIITTSIIIISITITNKNLSDNATSRVALRLIATCVPKDSDGDGIPDQQDYDSDNDAILDLIEGQGQHFVALSNTDTNHDGIDDAYGAGVVPTDTDNDTVSDYLDLDGLAESILISEPEKENLIPNLKYDFGKVLLK